MGWLGSKEGSGEKLLESESDEVRGQRGDGTASVALVRQQGTESAESISGGGIFSEVRR